MADLSLRDAFLLERVTDPNSDEFARMFDMLITDSTDDRTPAQKLRSKGEFKYTLPYRGEPDEEVMVRELSPFKFADRGAYRNGISSLAFSVAEVLDLCVQASGKNRTVPALVVTAEDEALKVALGSSGGISAMLHFTIPDELIYYCLNVLPDTLIFDHTSICAPIDEVLNLAFKAGVHIVDGVFPYHVSAVRGWDCNVRIGNWSYTHSKGYLTVGPNDDPSRLIKYAKSDYMKFVDPSRWVGNARKYGYELRSSRNGLVVYRAVYLGDAAENISKENMMFSLPVCSSEDMVLVSINRELATGVFASHSNNAKDLAQSERNYAIEVRRELFVTCVDFLMSRDRGADIVGDAVRYITEHNYVDLVDGIRIVRKASLSYADALCVSMVCALTAFSLRYRLTSESLSDIYMHQITAKMTTSPPLGALGQLVWYMGSYVYHAVSKLYVRAVESAREILAGSDRIPGVCYDVYTTVNYSPELDWFEPATLVLEEMRGSVDIGDKTDDAITEFLANAEKTSAPTAIRTKVERPSAAVNKGEASYKHKPDPNPAETLNHVYDQAFPGNSTAQLDNVAERRRVNDIEINTEFYGRIEINKNVVANERLHPQKPVRTAALPISNTSLVDAILASAKRNFNPPDMQQQNDPWAYANYLVDKFVAFAFDPNFDSTLGETYRKDPITFNVVDYLEWRAGKDTAYKSALEAECPNDLVELNLEKYDTIIKKRIKPKLSTSAQFELSQPQVVVSLSKKDTAPFTSIFRRMFERLEAALRPQLKSAGRMSDSDITDWLTEHKSYLMALECLEIDSSKYDKSQGLLARMIEALLLIRLGLDPGVYEIFQDSYVGKVSSRALGLMFISAYQMKSGAPQTMLGNTIYNMVSAAECVGTHNIRYMIAKGDDNLVWILHGLNKTSVVDKMSSLFNLECKLLTGEVCYFSSGYIILVGNILYFVPDPMKMIELLGEIGQDPRTLVERHRSFADKVSMYRRDHAIPRILQEAVRARHHNPNIAVVLAIDALISLADSLNLFGKTVPS